MELGELVHSSVSLCPFLLHTFPLLQCGFFSGMELLQECLSALPRVTLGCQAQLCPAEGLLELTVQPLPLPTQPTPTAPQLPAPGQYISLCVSQYSGTFCENKIKMKVPVVCIFHWDWLLLVKRSECLHQNILALRLWWRNLQQV